MTAETPRSALLTIAPKPFSPHVLQEQTPAGLSVLQLLARAVNAGALDPDDLPLVVVFVDGEPLAGETPDERRAQLGHVPPAGAEVTLAVQPQGGSNGQARGILQFALMAVAVVASFTVGPFTASLWALAANVIPNVLFPLNTPNTLPDGNDRGALQDHSNAVRKRQMMPLQLSTADVRARVGLDVAALPYSRLIGNDVWFQIALGAHYGPCLIEDIKIGETLLADYPAGDVQVEVFAAPGVRDSRLYPGTVHQENLTDELTFGGDFEVHTTTTGTRRVEIDLTWPGGLRYTKENGTTVPQETRLQVEWRPVGGTWTAAPLEGAPHRNRQGQFLPLGTIDVQDRTNDPVRRTIGWETGGLGQYDVRIRAWDPDGDDASRAVQDVVWTALRSMDGTKKPILDEMLSVVVLSIRSSEDLGGTLPTVTAVVTPLAPTYTEEGWQDALEDWTPATSPVALTRMMLTGPAAAVPVTEWDASADDQHVLCVANGWTGSVRLDQDATQEDALNLLGAMGRYSVFDAGEGLCFTPDWHKPAPRQLFDDRNVQGYQLSRAFPEPCHGVIVEYANLDADGKADELVVYNDGFDETTAELFDSYQLPFGCTQARAFKEGRVYLAKRQLLVEGHEWTASAESIACSLGDWVRLQHPTGGNVLEDLEVVDIAPGEGDTARIRAVRYMAAEIEAAETGPIPPLVTNLQPTPRAPQPRIIGVTQATPDGVKVAFDVEAKPGAVIEGFTARWRPSPTGDLANRDWQPLPTLPASARVMATPALPEAGDVEGEYRVDVEIRTVLRSRDVSAPARSLDILVARDVADAAGFAAIGVVRTAPDGSSYPAIAVTAVPIAAVGLQDLVVESRPAASVSDDDWRSAGQPLPAENPSGDFTAVDGGRAYDLRGRWRTTDGWVGEWAIIEDVQVPADARVARPTQPFIDEIAGLAGSYAQVQAQLGDLEAVFGDTDAAGAARQAAEAAQALSEAARNVAVGARDTAVQKAQEAAGSAGAAFGHATYSDGRANAAEGFALSAEASATVVRAFARDLLPSGFQQPELWTLETGTPPSQISITLTEADIVSVSGLGRVYQRAGGVAYLTAAGWRQIEDGRTYRSSIRYRRTVPQTDGRDYQTYVGFVVFAADGTFLQFRWVPDAVVNPALGAFRTHELALTAENLRNPAAGGHADAAFIRPVGIINWGNPPFFDTNSTSQVQFLRIEDVTESLRAEGFAQAGYDHSQAALAYRNASGDYASASYTERVLAETARGQAQTYSEQSAGARDTTLGYRNAAFDARTDAFNYRDAALGARDLTLGYRDTTLAARDTAVGARDVATGARDVAAGARDTALGYRNDTDGFRVATLAARDAALGYRSEAEGFRNDTYGARDAAALSAAGASTAQGVAVNAQTAARRALQAQFPSTMTRPEVWTYDETSPNQVDPPPLEDDFFRDAHDGVRVFYCVNPPGGGGRLIATRQAFVPVPGRRYRVTARVRYWGLAARDPGPDVRSWVGFCAVTTDGAPHYNGRDDVLNAIPVEGGATVSAGGVFRDIAFTWEAPAGAAYRTCRARTHLLHTTSVSDAEAQLVSLLFEDVSESNAAAGFSSTANVKAGEALQSAQAANSARTDAFNYSQDSLARRNEAATYRDQTSGFRDDAAGQASAAVEAAGLAAKVTRGFLNPNSNFSRPGAWSTGPTAGVPPFWNDWAWGWRNSTREADETIAAYARRVSTPGDVEQGINWPSGTGFGPGTYVVEGTVTLEYGTFAGSGLLLHVLNEDYSFVGQGLCDFFAEVGGGVPGRTYTISKYLDLRDLPSGKRINLHAFDNWGGFGRGIHDKNIRWHLAGVRPATASEIELGEARGGAATLSARVNDVSQAVATGDAALSGRLTTFEAKSDTGNIVPKAQFYKTAQQPGGVVAARAPWYTGWNNGNCSFDFSLDGDRWGVRGEDVLHIYSLSPAGSGLGHGDYVVRIDGVLPNRRYAWSANAWAHRADTEIFWQCYDADGVMVRASYDGGAPGFGGDRVSGHNFGFYGDGASLKNTKRCVSFLTTHPDTAYVLAYLRKGATLDGGDSHGWFAHPMFSLAKATDTLAPDFSPANTEARVSQVMIAENKLRDRVQSTAGLTVAAGSRVAGMRLHAVDGTDESYSSVDFQADVFRVFNGVTGQAPFEVRDSVVKMRAALIDRLSVGTRILLGSGGVMFAVAVQPEDVQVTDGQVVNFGYDLGNNPTLAFAGNNLAPLNAGERYNLYADNLSPTGFIARLKIITPGTPSNVAQGPVTSESANGPATHAINLSAVSSSGSYDVRITGNQRFRVQGAGGGTIGAEPNVDGEIQITVWGWNGGAWVALQTIWINPPWTGYSDGVYDLPYDRTESVSASSNISWIGVSVASATYPQSNVGTLTVSYQAPGTAGGTRSATPNGEVSTVTVRPRNA